MLKRSVFLILLSLFLSSAFAKAQTESAVLSFKEWKGQKIQLAQIEYKSLEESYLDKKKETPQDPKLKSLYSELRSAKESLGELGELTVTDYFIAYLSQFKDKKAVFQTALSKLASDEISELMTAYANSLLRTSGEGIPAAAENQKVEPAKSY
jgi:hypothetical protein